MPYPTLTLLAVPVVDIDGTVFVQGGLFLLLCLILNFLLFKPWLRVRDLRTVRIDGALERSKEVLLEANTLEEQYAMSLKSAREKAMGTRSEQRAAAEQEEAGVVGRARIEAAATLEQTRKELEKDAATARTSLSGRVDSLAKDVVAKILGRAA
jgi:F-type H+-transporting ATPase subunit b